MNTQRTHYFFWLLTLLVLVGCRKVKTTPPLAQGYDSTIQATPSYLTGPVTFNLSALEKKINESLDPVLVSESTMKGKRGEKWHLRVERMGPVKLKYARQRVTFTAPLRVWIDSPLRLSKRRRANRRAICALRVDFQTPLAVADNWQLSTKATFVKYEWIEKPNVRVLGLKIGITKLADMVLRKRRTTIEAAIDSAVHNELRLDRQVLRIWRDIQRPLLISHRPDSVWLIPYPNSITAGPISGNAQTITLPLRIGFQTDTRVGARPVVPPAHRLPRLRKVAHLSDESDLQILCFVPYADINRLLERTLQGRSISMEHGSLTVKNASVYGSQRAVVLKADVGGTLNGTLYLKGQPRYDTLDHVLRIQNVDFDVETEEMLLSTADWLLHNTLRDTLQAALRIPLQKQILQLPQKIESAFMRGNAGKKTTLDIASFRFVPQRMAVRPDGLQVLIKIESKVNLVVKRL
ncbi:MAG: DUF4403 family protein [Bacteroidetes bacterium]|nr:DUF4403 family protein [Fibrella sp.]